MAPRKPKAVIVEEPTSTCKSCRHAHFQGEFWTCRRYPPVVVYDIAEQGAYSQFPIVEPQLTCGEFAGKLNS